MAAVSIADDLFDINDLKSFVDHRLAGDGSDQLLWAPGFSKRSHDVWLGSPVCDNEELLATPGSQYLTPHTPSLSPASTNCDSPPPFPSPLADASDLLTALTPAISYGELAYLHPQTALGFTTDLDRPEKPVACVSPRDVMSPGFELPPALVIEDDDDDDDEDSAITPILDEDAEDEDAYSDYEFQVCIVSPECSPPPSEFLLWDEDEPMATPAPIQWRSPTPLSISPGRGRGKSLPATSQSRSPSTAASPKPASISPIAPQSENTFASPSSRPPPQRKAAVRARLAAAAALGATACPSSRTTKKRKANNDSDDEMDVYSDAAMAVDSDSDSDDGAYTYTAPSRGSKRKARPSDSYDDSDLDADGDYDFSYARDSLPVSAPAAPRLRPSPLPDTRPSPPKRRRTRTTTSGRGDRAPAPCHGPCDGCDALERDGCARKVFTRGSDLRRHLRTQRLAAEGGGMHACGACGKELSRADALARHERLHCRVRRR